MNKKRITVIASKLGGGGAERVASLLTNYLAEQGHTVQFIAAHLDKREYPLNEEVTYTAIQTNHKNSILRLLERSGKITKAVKEFHSDAVYSFITYDLISLVNAPGIDVIPSMRAAPEVSDRKFIYRHLRRYVFHRAKYVVFQTEGAKSAYDQKIQSKGVIIPNPLTSDLGEWNEEEHSNTMIAACRISTSKNIPMMLEAFKKFHEIHPEYTLEIYGDGDPASYKTKMEDLCKELGADSYIHFMGHTSQIHELMRTSAAFLQTSDYEGLSNSMLEAMSVGIPCVITDCAPGGARAFITNEETGMLVRRGDVQGMAGAMCKVAESVSLQHKLHMQERYVKDVLDRNVICRKWEDLLK